MTMRERAKMVLTDAARVNVARRKRVQNMAKMMKCDEADDGVWWDRRRRRSRVEDGVSLRKLVRIQPVV
jgi:hypothetical protein